MARTLTSALLVVGLAGCTGPNKQFSFSGFDVLEFFEFDGQRTWEFVSTDGDLPYLLIGVLDQETETIDDGTTRIHTIDFHKDCLRDENCVEEEFVRSMSWSANGTYGVRIHSYTLGSDAEVVLDPPLDVSPPDVVREEFVETEIDGDTWVSTMIGVEPCPVQWNVDWDECLKYEIDDGDGDLTTGSPISGTYWVVTGYNVVAVEWAGSTGRWELKRHLFEEN